MSDQPGSTALPRPVREGDRLKAGREGAVCGVASVDATGFAFAYNGTRYHRTWEGAKRLGWTHEDGAPIEPPQLSTGIACPSNAAPMVSATPYGKTFTLADMGRVYFHIADDGTFRLGPGVTNDEAARLFVQCVNTEFRIVRPGDDWKKAAEVNRLRANDAERRAAALADDAGALRTELHEANATIGRLTREVERLERVKKMGGGR